MDKRKIQANLFVAVMVALGVGVLWRWHSIRAAAAPKPVDVFEPTVDARQATSKETLAAHESIEGQLKAFKADNYELAAVYQSSALRSSFPSIRMFRSAIQHGFPEFSRCRSVQYGPIRANKDGSYLTARVLVTGEDGVTVHAGYLLHRENGIYRVAEVVGGFHISPSMPPGSLPPRHGFDHGGPDFNHRGQEYGHGGPDFDHWKPGYGHGRPDFDRDPGFAHGGPGFDRDNPGIDRQSFTPQPS